MSNNRRETKVIKVLPSEPQPAREAKVVRAEEVAGRSLTASGGIQYAMQLAEHAGQVGIGAIAGAAGKDLYDKVVHRPKAEAEAPKLWTPGDPKK